MDLSTRYLGFDLKNPLVPGASPLMDNLDTVKQLEDAGAPALIMRSLFEEQIERERTSTVLAMEMPADSFAEALSYFPHQEDLKFGPEQYLEQIRRIKEAVAIPVIASLNGTTPAGWVDYARLIQQAGADALELNVYFLATDLNESGSIVEKRLLDIVRDVKSGISIPLAVKLSVFYSSISNLASQLDGLGVEGLVIFNRFYQPDIDIETLDIVPRISLSDSSELLLRLRWLAILSGHLRASLSVSGGVHTPVDAIKSVMAGAHSVQMVSALLQKGPDYLGTVLAGIKAWMEKHEYESITQMQGSMNLLRSPDPAAFERANYARVLHSWRPM
jgi:dihydroorotate dehydrogenase (fumarate)